MAHDDNNNAMKVRLEKGNKIPNENDKKNSDNCKPKFHHPSPVCLLQFKLLLLGLVVPLALVAVNASEQLLAPCLESLRVDVKGMF